MASTLFSIVEINGRQHCVREGDVVTIDRLAGEPGSTLSFKPFLSMVDGDIKWGDADSAIRVEAEVIDHVSGKKVNSFTYKAKVRTERRVGHRPKHTRLKITAIHTGKKDAKETKGTEGPKVAKTTSSTKEQKSVNKSTRQPITKKA